jgi:hypothetical protein
VLRALWRHDPNAVLYGEDNVALLRAHQLDRAPEYVPLAGPLAIALPSGGVLQELADRLAVTLGALAHILVRVLDRPGPP